MNSIGTSIIWMESPEELAVRWVVENPTRAGQAELDGDELARQLRRRSEAVRRSAKLERPREIKTARQWETHWNPQHAEEKLHAVLHGAGWEAVVTDKSITSPLDLAGAGGTESDAIVIEQWAADDLARDFQKKGLLLPFSARDAFLLLLAREIYEIFSARVGRKDTPSIVDRIAPDVFSQEVLGWPFCPWAAEFL